MLHTFQSKARQSQHRPQEPPERLHTVRPIASNALVPSREAARAPRHRRADHYRRSQHGMSRARGLGSFIGLDVSQGIRMERLSRWGSTYVDNKLVVTQIGKELHSEGDEPESQVKQTKRNHKKLPRGLNAKIMKYGPRVESQVCRRKGCPALLVLSQVCFKVVSFTLHDSQHGGRSSKT